MDPMQFTELIEQIDHSSSCICLWLILIFAILLYENR
jgi:hypothetical protein